MLVECQKLLDDKKKEIKQKMTEIRVLKDSVQHWELKEDTYVREKKAMRAKLETSEKLVVELKEELTLIKQNLENVKRDLVKAKSSELVVPTQPKKAEYQDSFLERDEQSRESLQAPVLEGRDRLKSESDFDRADNTPREDKKFTPKKDTEDSFMDRDDISESKS